MSDENPIVYISPMSPWGAAKKADGTYVQTPAPGVVPGSNLPKGSDIPGTQQAPTVKTNPRK
jgi:hypothetical protein